MTDSGVSVISTVYAGGNVVRFIPSHYVSGQTTDFVVHCHGMHSSVAAIQNYPVVGRSELAILQALGRRWPTCFGDWPGAPASPATDSWGNDQAASTLGVLLSTLHTTYGGRAMMLGVSMGHDLATRMAVEHPTIVKTVAGVIPLTNVQHVLDDNFAAEMIPSYQAAWATSSTTATPSSEVFTRAATMKANGTPWAGWDASNDTVVRPADLTAFGAAVGGPAAFVGTDDHTQATIAEVPIDDLTRFLATGHV